MIGGRGDIQINGSDTRVNRVDMQVDGYYNVPRTCMSILLLKTKLSAPLTRPDLVARQRLIDQISAGLWQAEGCEGPAGGVQPRGFARKLTLVSAPAGYGKTTLVADWLQRHKIPAVWLSLDEADNDPARFLAYLLAAFQQIDAQIGAAAQAMLPAPQPTSGEGLLITILNDLAERYTTGEGRQPFALVLDDYQVIQTPLVHRQVSFLLEHQPACIHLVLLTREDPLLPIARLRSQGQICEIRQEDLRFTAGESDCLLRQNLGLHLEPDDLETLQERTEGWVAGLQLASLSMCGVPNLHKFVQSFAGSNRYILDYLFEETFSRQSQDTQDFLLSTSVLERLSAGLCDAVAGQTGSRERLESLERANLFIVSLDLEREWYRYHHLFRELLRHQLHRRSEAAETHLHQRACQWYAAEGFAADAIQHAIAAQDWGTACRLIGKASEDLLKRGQYATLIGWFHKLPAEAACSDPSLCMAFAWAMLLASRFDLASTLLEHAGELVQPGTAFGGQVAAAQAYLARAQGDEKRLIERSQQALAWLPQEERVSRGNVALNLGIAYWHAGRLEEAERVLLEAQSLSSQTGNYYGQYTARIFLARTQASRGKLRQAEAMAQAVIREGGRGGENPILALGWFDLGAIYLEWNDTQKAGECIQRGLEMSVRSGNVEFQASGQMLHALLALAQGNLPAASEAMEAAQALSPGLPAGSVARCAACQVVLALASGDLAKATLWVEKAGDEVDAHPFYRFLSLTRARLLLAEGQAEAALDRLDARYETASRSAWGFGMIAVRVLQALAAEAAERAGKVAGKPAVDYLAEALRMGQVEGFLRTFVDAGPRLAPILREAALQGAAPEMVGRILSALGAREPPAGEAGALVEALSERELEVLRLVTAGFSNREIGEKLFVSPGTVKTHIHNLCGKLGVRNRTEAVARALALKLV